MLGDIRDKGSIPGLGRSPGGGLGNPLQCSCLGNPMDRVAWWATVHGVTKSQTGLKCLSTHTRARRSRPKPVSLIYLRRNALYCMLSRLQYTVDITCVCTRKPEYLCGMLYCSMPFFVVIWNQTAWGLPAFFFLSPKAPFSLQINPYAELQYINSWKWSCLGWNGERDLLSVPTPTSPSSPPALSVTWPLGHLCRILKGRVTRFRQH